MTKQTPLGSPRYGRRQESGFSGKGAVVDPATIPMAVCYRCLDCGGELRAESTSRIVCQTCNRAYPAVLGIVDMRETEQETLESSVLVEKLLAAYPSATWAELVEVYFSAVDLDGLPQGIVDHYKNYRDTQLTRGQKFTKMFLKRLEDRYGQPIKETVLEIGCGSGASLVALAGQFEHVVGLDPSLPSLIIALKLLEEKQIGNVQLVLAYGQRLPFDDNTFNYITAQNVLEHVFEAREVVAEIQRVLQPGGYFTADSRNRYDILFPEPHVNIRWVGLLPRKWANRYVQWRTGAEYQNTYLLSYRELKSALSWSFGENYQIVFPGISAYGHSEKLESLVLKIEQGGPLSKPFLMIFPSHLALAQKKGAHA